MLNAQTPALATDNEWLAVGVEQTRYTRMKLSGGEPFVLCDACLDGTWGDDGNFYFSRAGEIWRRRPDGSGEEVVLEPSPERGVGYLARPVILPGSRAALVEVGNYVRGGVVAMNFADQRVVPISSDGSGAHLLAHRARALPARQYAVRGALRPGDARDRRARGARAHRRAGGERRGGAGRLWLTTAPSCTHPRSVRRARRLSSWIVRWPGGACVRGSGATMRRHASAPTASAPPMIVNEAGSAATSGSWISRPGRWAQITTVDSATSPAWSLDGAWIAFGAAKGRPLRDLRS